MRQILTIIITIELIGAAIFGIYYLKYFPTWQEAFVQGFFASVSATTNAGFDITGASLMPFEVKDFLLHRGSFPYKFTLFTKLTTVTFFSLVILGALVIYLFEQNLFLADKSWHETIFYSLFQSTTTRSGGLSTMDVSGFSEPTLLFISVMMFVGASPSSVGGGIRTTTFAIVMLSIFFYAKGKDTIKIFGREVDPDDIHRAFIVITTAILICCSSIILLTILEPTFTLVEIIFEVTSAFGTTGLSMGITPELSTPGKFIIIALMFIGRIGIFSFLFLIRGTTVQEKFHYPKEKVIIG